jgi:hypothetical protein
MRIAGEGGGDAQQEPATYEKTCNRDHALVPDDWMSSRASAVGNKNRSEWIKEMRDGAQSRMKKLLSQIATVSVLASAITVGLAATAAPAAAKGCIKGAVVGGVAGHMAGHHGLLGAAAGCAIGHHEAAKNAKENQNPPPNPQQ